MLTRLNPANLFDPTPFGFAQAVVAPAGARIAFLSGQGAGDATGGLPSGFEAQIAGAFANLGALLSGIGARPDQVARLTIYIVDHDPAKLGPVTRAVVGLFGDDLPAQTLVPVPRLALEGMLVEVEAVAVLT